MIFLHYTPQTLAWRTSSYLCRSPDQEKEDDEDQISYFQRGSAKELFLIFKEALPKNWVKAYDADKCSGGSISNSPRCRKIQKERQQGLATQLIAE